MVHDRYAGQGAVAIVLVTLVVALVGEHVYRGVAGMFIVDDDRSRRLGLPDEYGVDDVPVIVQDKRLDGSGNLDYSAR